MARPRIAEADAVLDAAERRLIADGLAATTVDAVAMDAGVSRATVYRYVGGKQEIVQAVLLREAAAILERTEAVVLAAPNLERAMGDAVSTILHGVEEHPLLARLTSTDLAETLTHLTVDSVALVSIGVRTLGPAFRRAPAVEVDDRSIDDAIEEAARFVFTHLTTPRRGGVRLSPDDAGTRAARLIVPMARPVDGTQSHRHG